MGGRGATRRVDPLDVFHREPPVPIRELHVNHTNGRPNCCDPTTLSVPGTVRHNYVPNRELFRPLLVINVVVGDAFQGSITW
jgi:hypothetical protein